jgi:RHS repeat-associated protein
LSAGAAKSVAREAAAPSGPALLASTTTSTEIQALARALENDVDLIFEHVYENIEYTPIYGSVKGATATLIEGRGNDFDQSSLMVALLRESGYTANFVYGVLRLLPAQLTSWLGVPPDPSVLSTLLGSAGIPAVIWTYPDTSLAFVDVDHVWVKVDIGGTDYVFAPALKARTAVAGIDLGTAMGYDQATLLSGALTGATVDPDYIQNVNTPNLHSSLATYTGNLVSYIETNLPGGGLADVIGGATIDPVAGPLRDTALADQLSITADWVEIPDIYRAQMRVQHLGIDQSFWSDSIAGQRITLFYDDATNQPTLYLGGAPLATGSAAAPGSGQNLTLSVDHPYAAGGGTYGDASQTLQVLAGGSYIVVNGWGGTGSALVDFHRDQLEANVHAGGAVDSEPVLGESLAMIAFSWLAEDTRASDLADRVANLVTIHHHTLGVSGQNQSPYVDLPLSFASVVSASGDAAAATSGFFNGSGHSSAFEWGVIDQLQPPHSAVCTVKLLDLSNTQSDRVFDADSANYFGVIKPQLVNYSAFEYASVEVYINAGYRVILPQDGDLTEGSWSGIGFLAISPSENSIGHIIAGGLKGGFGTDPWTAGDMDTTPESNSDPHEKSEEPIDLVTGDYLYESTDLRVGSGEHPFALEFRRSYNSSKNLQRGSLGLGWSHNFDVRATPGSDGFEGMGRDSAIDAAAVIVQQFVAADLLTGPKTQDRVLIATIAHRWFMDRLIDNVVTVSEPGNSGTYALLPDGSYNPPPGLASVLTQEPDTSYRLDTKHGIVLDFEPAGGLGTWQDPNGNTVTLTYVSDSLQSVSNSLGRTLSFSYTGDLLTQISDGTGRDFDYAYDAAGNLTSVTDAENQTTTLEYVSDGMLAKIYYPAYPVTPFVTNTYDALGHIETQTDGGGNLWTYYFSGFRSKEVDPATRARVWSFDENGRTLGELDALGNETRYEYDGLQRITRRTHPEGNAIEFEYDDRSNLAREIIHPKPASLEAPIEWLYSFEPLWNRLSTVTDPLSRVTAYTYDGSGNPTKVEQPAVGGVIPETDLVYNARGQVESVTDPELRVTAYAYDPVTGDLLSRTVDPLGLALATQRAYDAVGNVFQETDPRGNTVTFQYDDMRRLTQLTAPLPLGYVTQYAYDANGNLSQIDRETGGVPQPWQTTVLTHTVTNKTETITDPELHMTSRQFDALDRLWRETDAEGSSTEFLYDERGDVHQVIDDQLNVVEERSYTPNGREASLRDANLNLTLFEYDDFDRLARKVYADTSSESFTRDDAGNLTQVLTRAGDAIGYAYDELDRIEQKTLPGPVTISYVYDLAGKLEDVTDPTGPIHHVWDAAGRMTSVTRPDGKTVVYEYDANDNRTKVVYPDGFFVTYEHDVLNRLADVRDPSPSSLAHYDYDALSRRIGETHGNGTSVVYGYEIDDDVTSVQHTLTGESVTFTYAYDAVHKETASGVTDARFLFGVPSDTPTSYTPNALNQYADVGGATYVYDGNGNLVSDGVSTYLHDAESRLVQATTPSHVASYAYDAFGRRREKTVDGAVTRYVYAGDRVLEEYDGANVLQRRFVHGPGIDEPVSMAATGATYYYHFDKLGSVVGLSDAGGNLVETHTYSPYGKVDTPSAVGNPFHFTGRRLDPETGLYHYRARSYDPGLGRFLEVDPVRHVGGINLYAYVQNDPLNFLDPFGLFRFGKRPLSGAPWIPGGSSNPIDNYFNTEISHEHGFFEDGSGENVGFGPEGRFTEDPTDLGYRYDDTYFDDDLIREALGNIEDGEYSLLGWGDPKKNNCQDWADRLRDEYERLERERNQADETPENDK